MKQHNKTLTLLQWHCRGRRFDSVRLHQYFQTRNAIEDSASIGRVLVAFRDRVERGNRQAIGAGTILVLVRDIEGHAVSI